MNCDACGAEVAVRDGGRPRADRSRRLCGDCRENDQPELRADGGRDLTVAALAPLLDLPDGATLVAVREDTDEIQISAHETVVPIQTTEPHAIAIEIGAWGCVDCGLTGDSIDHFATTTCERPPGWELSDSDNDADHSGHEPAADGGREPPTLRDGEGRDESGHAGTVAAQLATGDAEQRLAEYRAQDGDSA